jgi:hypothetical protein
MFPFSFIHEINYSLSYVKVKENIMFVKVKVPSSYDKIKQSINYIVEDLLSLFITNKLYMWFTQMTNDRPFDLLNSNRQFDLNLWQMSNIIWDRPFDIVISDIPFDHVSINYIVEDLSLKGRSSLTRSKCLSLMTRSKGPSPLTRLKGISLITRSKGISHMQRSNGQSPMTWSNGLYIYRFEKKSNIFILYLYIYKRFC